MNEKTQEVTLSKCTKQKDFESMKSEFIRAINDLKKGAKVVITTEQEDDGFITCMTGIEFDNYGMVIIMVMLNL